MENAPIALAGLTIASAAALCAILILLLLPVLKRHLLARPNRRSSHREPTPQGGGIAVIAATVVVVATSLALTPAAGDILQLAMVFAATLALAVVGALDDIHTLEVVPRLLLQTVFVAVTVAALPLDLRIVEILPWWIERSLLLLAGVWFVNLVNFMDGIDLLTVAEIAPMSATLTLFGLLGFLPSNAMLVAAALCGAIIGFSPFNRPVARLFLGDVGSVPIGLLMGWLLFQLAGAGYVVAALLLPLYYLSDATTTLLCRLGAGEPILQAHRSHFYQRAVDGGLTVYQIVGRIFVANLMLSGLATMTLFNDLLAAHAIGLSLGGLIVGTLLWNFRCGSGNRGTTRASGEGTKQGMGPGTAIGRDTDSLPD